MAGRPYLFNPDERLDELHWVLSYHVHHLGRMADEMDRLSLPQAAKDFRQSVATWDRLLQEIEDARGIGRRQQGRTRPGLFPSAALAGTRPSGAPRRPAASSRSRALRLNQHGPNLRRGTSKCHRKPLLG